MSYAIGLAPIVLPLLFTPTLDEMQGRELQRDYVLPLDWQFVRKNMVYSKKNVDDGRWWTHVTYAFVHKDLEHVYNNFAMLLPSAISVQSEYGIFGLWLTFFGGCCLGTRNIGRVKEIQHEVAMNSYFGNSNGTSYEGSFWSDPLNATKTAWSKSVGFGASVMAPVVSYYCEYVGCSTGCCALLGLDFCTSVETITHLLFHAENDIAVSSLNEEEVIMRLTSHAMSCYFTVNMIVDEWNAFQNSGSSDGKDHAGHVVGLASGVVCYLGFSLFRLRRRHSK
mmetsp:Transcript_9068/g.17034  ORF Transcript_9068/g.17034 Transcript_9068/m.17034 type:complete len:280 (-) Transcript_9068:522-1361(-)|eukprot:CAMPEP_0203762288 /NCGR_PEP_ID=MMETSP0098-20131031/15215_1 /ASSEMBLY_ACC=CAM_ASM_000208 /TAXON_ID=96639 /ORGANISM=" , Strain NY0313808BC1" /LENGTH=279 /DNA_ID=CAMNT_0050656645 /DNA_START=151 /DNA_END=990 /DNA_ORIENTATION=-